MDIVVNVHDFFARFQFGNLECYSVSGVDIELSGAGVNTCILSLTGDFVDGGMGVKRWLTSRFNLLTLTGNEICHKKGGYSTCML